MPNRFLLFLSIILLFISCEKEKSNDVNPTVNRTILVYIMGDNSLSGYVNYDIEEMKEAVAAGVLGKNNNLVVYIDDKETPRLIRIKEQSGKAVTEIIRNYDEQTSVSKSVMTSVFSETFHRFPAYSYGLVLWSHGDGWLPDTSGKKKITTRWIGADGDFGPYMEIKELVDVLALFPKFEFIFFDACFMQSIEVAYDLQDYTKYMIGSVTETPGTGAPYHKILKFLYEPECNIEGMISNYYDYYLSTFTNAPSGNNQIWPYGCSISAIKCENINELTAKTREIIANADLSNPDVANIQIYDLRARRTSYGNLCCYYDFNGFIRSIASDKTYSEWKSLLDDCIPENYRKTTKSCYSAYINNTFSIDQSQYCGISSYIILPNDKFTATNEKYKELNWYKAVY